MNTNNIKLNDNIKLNIYNNSNNNTNSDTSHSNNINRLLDIVRKTYISIQKYKLLNIVNGNELYSCIISLQNIAIHLKHLLSLVENVEEISCTTALKEIEKDLLLTIRSYGTDSIEDLFYLYFNNNFIIDKDNECKYKLLKAFAHPMCYTVLEPNSINTNNLVCRDLYNESINNESINNSNEPINNESISVNINNDIKHFNIKVHCIELIICHNNQRLSINCLIDDIKLDMLNNDYMNIICSFTYLTFILRTYKKGVFSHLLFCFSFVNLN